MLYKIASSQHTSKVVMGILGTLIIAIPLSWLISYTFVFLVKSLHYRTVQFAPFVTIFVSEEEVTHTMGRDFDLHPNIFKRNGTTYSAIINERRIEFVARNRTDRSDYPCDATVDDQPIGCKEFLYFPVDDSIIGNGYSEYIRLTGGLGMTAEQAQQLNAPHIRFEKQLETIKLPSFIASILLIFYSSGSIGWRVLQKRIGDNNGKQTIL